MTGADVVTVPRLTVDVFTVFPEMFDGPMSISIVGRARQRGIIEFHTHNLRDWTTDRHRSVDDTPFGGGSGMVMKVAPIVEAVEAIAPDRPDDTVRIVCSAAGRQFHQRDAVRLAGASSLAIVCGHYEGIDDRVPEILGAEEISIGDFVLTGGELAAMVIVDAVIRLVPGVIDAASTADESHSVGLLEYPHYTRPEEYRGHRVPPVLLSGHHAKIAAWRREQAIERTRDRRPDLLD